MCPTPRAPISATRYRVSRVDPGDRQRQADLVVEVAVRGHRRAGGLEHLGQQVLGRGLALRAGDRRRPASPPAVPRSTWSGRAGPARPAGPATTRHRGVGDRARGEGGDRAGGEGPGDEVVAVGPLARQRHEERAGRDVRPASRHERRPGRRRVAAARPSVGARARPPPRATRQLDHRGRLVPRGQLGPARRATTSASSNGQHPPADLLAALVALAEHRDDVAGRRGQGRARSRRAGRRRPTHLAARPALALPGRPASTSARIARRILASAGCRR